MTERKWTPGPWKLGKEKKVSEIWNIEILGEQGYSLVSTCYGTTTGLADWYAGARDVKANAHLIAAAPDLYEAVIELQEALYDACEGRKTTIGNAALSKARGETNV